MLEISPDIQFITELEQRSGAQLKTCMQCGACTSACELSSDQNVFPRKQMIYASWGLKEQLMADPNIWTCHQCGDCTLTCPRGVKPGEVLAALRSMQIRHYARPAAVARIMEKPAFMPLVLGFPVVIISLILVLAETFTIPSGAVDYSKFFPHGWLNGSFTLLFMLATLGAVISMRSFWKNMKNKQDSADSHEAGPDSLKVGPGSPAGQEFGFFRVLWDIMRHRDFSSCKEQKFRSIPHFLLMWGFGLLLLVTFFAILSTVFFDYPLGFLNPIKIAGNVGALMLLTGLSILIFRRLAYPDKLKSNYADWFLLISFWLLTVSGILVESARFLNWASAYHIYFGHLVLVWIIILYFPYTKFAHFFYRTVALLFLKNPRNSQ